MITHSLFNKLIISLLLIPSLSLASGGSGRSGDQKENREFKLDPKQQFTPAHFPAMHPLKESTVTGIGAAIGSTVGLLFGWAYGAESRVQDSSHSVAKSSSLGAAIGGGLGALAGYLTALSHREYNRKRTAAIEKTGGYDIRAAACDGNTEALNAWAEVQREEGHLYPFTRADRHGRTVLHYAAANGRTTTVNHILDNLPAHEDRERIVENTNLGFSLPVGNSQFSYNNNTTTTERYRFFHIDAQDRTHARTATHWAMYGNHRATAMAILNRGSNPFLRDITGSTIEILMTNKNEVFNKAGDQSFAQALGKAKAEAGNKMVAPIRNTVSTHSFAAH